MIEVKLEDFESYRTDLLKQANSLLFNSGCGNFKKGEIKEIAKDIVQETYLDFHKHYKDPFVTSIHLYNFIKICLYRKYQNTVTLKRASYNRLLDNNISKKLLEEFKGDSIYEEFDTIPLFMKKLNDQQKSIVIKLCEGYTQLEISKQLNCPIQNITRGLVDIRRIYLNEKKAVVKTNEKKVKQIDHNSVVIKIWNSGKEAADKLDLSASAISNCCKGKRQTHGQFKWKYNEESK